MTKPVDAKHKKQATVSCGERSKQQVETANDSNISPVETSESDAELTRQQDTPNKLRHTITCKICSGAFGSVKDLNDHHREDYGVVDCDLSDKRFETRTALDKHKYTHKEL